MIAGIGTDPRRDIPDRRDDSSRKTSFKNFTTTELAYAKDNATTLAGNFVRRSRFQSIWNRLFGVEPYEIEVLRNESGAPYVKLYGNAKEIAKDKQVSRIHVSITNTREFAQALR